MERLRTWLDAARPEHGIAVLSVAAGVACAHFDARPAGVLSGLLVTAAALAAGVAVGFVDRAWDAVGDAREAAAGAIFGVAAAAALGLAAAWISGSALLVYGGAAVLLGVWRRAPAIGGDTVGYGLGDLATVAALGPLAMLAGYASQGGEGSASAFHGGLPVGLAAEAASYYRHFTRRDADVALHRMTPVATLGEEQARLGALALPLIAAAAVVVVWRAGEFGAGATFSTVPLAVLAVVAARGLRGTPAADDDRTAERIAGGAAAAAVLVVAIAYWWGPPA